MANYHRNVTDALQVLIPDDLHAFSSFVVRLHERQAVRHEVILDAIIQLDDVSGMIVDLVFVVAGTGGAVHARIWSIERLRSQRRVRHSVDV